MTYADYVRKLKPGLCLQLPGPAPFNGAAGEFIFWSGNLTAEQRTRLGVFALNWPAKLNGEWIFPGLFFFTPEGRQWLNDLQTRLSETLARQSW